ncbi:cell division cycle 14 isoform a [Anaeramoeba flamelloides]|uniref:protein-tyrosine-phosphatase n=1 Tax=Anaeramoeba flamelloides TaxID=1746091 RepID=A0AAV8AJM0_9EUKA|nr:cell division cycle 14 isoform a [Anaeramoeba flamelloides]
MDNDKELAELIKNRLYFYISKRSIKKYPKEEIHFTIEKTFYYDSFFLDFGPFKLSLLVKFYRLLREKLDESKNSNKKFYFWSKNCKKKRTNSAVLICSFIMVYCSISAKEAYSKISHLKKFYPFHDASPLESTYGLNVLDVLEGLEKGIQNNWVDFDTFDIQWYEKHEKVINGDLNWIIPNKILAFCSPTPDQNVKKKKNKKKKKDKKKKKEIEELQEKNDNPNKNDNDNDNDDENEKKNDLKDSNSSKKKNKVIEKEEEEEEKEKEKEKEIKENKKKKKKKKKITSQNEENSTKTKNNSSKQSIWSWFGFRSETKTKPKPKTKAKLLDSNPSSNSNNNTISHTDNIDESTFESIDQEEIDDFGYGWPVSKYAEYFDQYNITCIVRLNQPIYNKKPFLKKGMSHYDLNFMDGSVPTEKLLNKFLTIAETEFESDKKRSRVMAIHCKAGLGRTGVMIGSYLIKFYNFTAKQAIAWLRLCRPGSVIGIQQQYLETFQRKLLHKKSKFRNMDQKRNLSSLKLSPQPRKVRRKTSSKSPKKKNKN